MNEISKKKNNIKVVGFTLGFTTLSLATFDIVFILFGQNFTGPRLVATTTENNNNIKAIGEEQLL